MEYANQLAGVIGCVFAGLALLLAYIVTPEGKQRVFQRITVQIVMFAVFVSGIAYIGVFAFSPGSPTHAEVIMLGVWAYNVSMAIKLRPKLSSIA
jgi:hypothetical protein